MPIKNIYYPELTSPLLKLHKIYPNQIHHFDLDQNTEWIKDILKENSPAFEEASEFKENGPQFECQFQLHKLDHGDLGDPIAIQGQINSLFWTECVRCLTPVPQKLEIEFNCAFIPSDKENHPELEDQDTYYNDSTEYDIFFFDGQVINIKELFNELIQINIDPFPLHDEDCKGLCQRCGTNLNHEKCQCPSK